jgi:signal transduction histidine kinase
MKGWRRDRGLWFTLLALAVLLVLLAVLQYRWVGEIVRAEAERRQSRLERSASRFASALDRELGRATLAFRLERAQTSREPAASVADRLALWQHGEDAGLVARVRLASVRDGQVALATCTPAGCLPEPWPAGLEALRRRLLRAEHGPGQPWPFRPAAMIDDPPMLLVPVFEQVQHGDPRPEADDPGEGRPPRFRVNGVVLLELDLAYLSEQLLPEVAEASLGHRGEAEFAVTLLRRRDRSILYTNEPDAAPGELRRADLEIPAPFGPRPGSPPPDDKREGRGGRRERLDARRLERFGVGRDEESAWLLLVRHRGGSLEQAVASVRHRNLALGLGVIGLLGGAGALLAIGAQRARNLARQQLEFVAGITHELNTPLAAIRSAAQNLSDGIVKDPQQVKRYGGLIEKEGSRLTSIVAQVLDFAGIESGARAYASDRVSLGQVVDAVLGDMRLALQQSGLAVCRELPEHLPDVIGDAAALRRVVSNLLANAVKFAGSGGQVTLRGAANGGTVVLRVEDRGPGIPAAERQRVFDAFYRGAAAQRNETPGSGLGLALVRKVVLAHRGKVRVEDPPGGGTAIVVELPAAPQSAEGGL